MGADGAFAPPPVGARLRVWLGDRHEWADALLVSAPEDGPSEVVLASDSSTILLSLTAANCQLLPPRVEGGASSAPGGTELPNNQPTATIAPVDTQVGRVPSTGLLSPIKPRFGITDVDDPESARALELGEPQPRVLPVADAIDEPEMATRVGPDFQADVPEYIGEYSTSVGPPTQSADSAAAAEPELLWAPHFEGVIRDLSREPPRAEIERYEELRRRQQKPCGIPGCLLHDKHPGPHIFPEPTGKRQGKTPWRGSPRSIAPAAPPKPKSAPRRAESDGTPDSNEEAGSGSASESEGEASYESSEDEPLAPGKRLNADRAARREARRLSHGASGRKRERQQLNYRAFGGIMPRGAAVDAGGTTTALAAAKAAKGDVTDRRNVGLMRRSARADDDGDDSRYERVPMINTRTGAIVRGKQAPMRMNVQFFIERYPVYEQYQTSAEKQAAAAAAARGGRGRGRGRGAGGGRGRGRWGNRRSVAATSSEDDDDDNDGGMHGSSGEEGSDDECSGSGEEEEGEDGEGEREMTQERVNSLFTLGSRVCAFPGCCKIYASTDGVRKHAKRCHMSWVLERDREKEGVWLEPMPTASDPQLFGQAASAAHPAKKHASRGTAGLSAQPTRRFCSGVPWTQPDKRKVIDRDRKQLWPLPHDEWLSMAVLDSSGWLLQPALSGAQLAPDGPSAKRACRVLPGAGDAGGDEHRAVGNGSTGSGSLVLGMGMDAWGRAGLGDGSLLREKLALVRDGDGRFDVDRQASLDDSSHETPSPADDSCELSPRGSQEWDEPTPPLPARPTYPVPGSRPQLPGLWPDLRPLPQLSGIPRPLPQRAMSLAQQAARPSRMNLHEMLSTPALRQLYFAAAGYTVPRPLQLTHEITPLHARPDQLVRMVYWRHTGAGAKAAP